MPESESECPTSIRTSKVVALTHISLSLYIRTSKVVALTLRVSVSVVALNVIGAAIGWFVQTTNIVDPEGNMIVVFYAVINFCQGLSFFVFAVDLGDIFGAKSRRNDLHEEPVLWA
ncbi:hypothetical protein KIPB_004762 [Kipferlia bialata]|uniref:Uncharacterized protein n=1 Tax=Kipferlia bialata TaxID=797122 RepID=A0A9K3GI13_9EUKA|nr:hypothetical protein KIPB_004762 [Kipferlia bialata]|eukprot:g4762.t1